MARLRAIPQRLGRVPPRLAGIGGAGGEVERDRARALLPWRQWYNSMRWRCPRTGLRWHILRRDRFTCQMCGRIEPDSAQLVADHRVPHRGDEALFWDAANLWCLCKPCHDGAKQREERG